MNPTALRKSALLILSVLLLFLCYHFTRKPAVPASSPQLGKQEYKVRAYILTKNDAEKIQQLGKGAGFTGSISRGPRTIRKLLGYSVTQELAGTKDSEKIRYVCEYLTSRGFKAYVAEEKLREKSVILRVGDIYPTEEQARKVAGEVYKNVSVSFSVKKQFEDVTYQSFVVVFTHITNREQALSLKSLVEQVTSDVELISF